MCTGETQMCVTHVLSPDSCNLHLLSKEDFSRSAFTGDFFFFGLFFQTFFNQWVCRRLLFLLSSSVINALNQPEERAAPAVNPSHGARAALIKPSGSANEEPSFSVGAGAEASKAGHKEAEVLKSSARRMLQSKFAVRASRPRRTHRRRR